MYSEWKCSRCV